MSLRTAELGLTHGSLVTYCLAYSWAYQCPIERRIKWIWLMRACIRWLPLPSWCLEIASCLTLGILIVEQSAFEPSAECFLCACWGLKASSQPCQGASSLLSALLSLSGSPPRLLQRELLDLYRLVGFRPLIPRGRHLPKILWVKWRAAHCCSCVSDSVPPVSTILLISFMYNDHIRVI